MTFETLAWLGMAAYSVHIMEEYQLNWRDWARGALRLPVEWSDFYVTNAIVVALGIAQGMLAPALPVIALGFAALMFINAILFHILPVIRTRGRFSPGLFTAVVLFLPLSIATFAKAISTDIAGTGMVIGAIAIGFGIMFYPIVLLRLKSKPYFVQTG